jgi:hypothetical protein
MQLDRAPNITTFILVQAQKETKPGYVLIYSQEHHMVKSQLASLFSAIVHYLKSFTLIGARTHAPQRGRYIGTIHPSNRLDSVLSLHLAKNGRTPICSPVRPQDSSTYKT